jgi:hypothetical protein
MSSEHNLRRKIKRLKSKKPKIPRTCKGCGKQFLFKKGGERYCSNDCRNLFHENEKQKAIEMDKIIKECRFCKKEFSIANKSRDVFCSKDCREKDKAQKYFKSWAEKVPCKKKHRDLKQIMFNDLRDKPSDSFLKRFRACRG